MYKAKVGLIGIGGFGRTHLNMIEKLTGDYIDFRAFSEVNYEKNKKKIETLKLNGINHYVNYEEMLEKENLLDFIIISTPIYTHKDIAFEVIKRGFNVLLEKPPAVTIQDIDALIEISKSKRKLCAVNFQQTSGKAFIKLLNYIKSGRLGVIKRITGVGIWSRDETYYQRTSWAGKITDKGNYILDGSLNNSLAHLLNNTLLLAEEFGKDNGIPFNITAELYHGNKIESEDTACLRILTQGNIEVLFYSTLCSFNDELPYIVIEGTKGTAYWDYNNLVKIKFYEGHEEIINFCQEDLIEKVYLNLINAIFENEKLYCPIENTRNFVLATNGAFESSNIIYTIDDKYIDVYKKGDKNTTVIKNIKNIIDRAAKDKMLFSELNVPWARKSKSFTMKNYKIFGKYK
ncbi:MAG: Gfo/Idh/MocA family protein [Thermoanaerobacteraceae bacterium]